jgi:GSH-dependent disulfide-bond oxidoreductase
VVKHQNVRKVSARSVVERCARAIHSSPLSGARTMIDLYTWNTPNGQKVHILLEELGLEYATHTVHISQSEQFSPDFLKISPNNKIPAIVDHAATGDVSVFESGAILIHLAEAAGKFLAPAGSAARADQLQWLMFQMGSIGPMMGQLYHFQRVAPEQLPYAQKRFGDEVHRLLGVMDRQLGEREYIAGEYSIADMALFPWVRGITMFGIDGATVPNVVAWIDRVAARPAVVRALELSKKAADEHRPTFNAPA